MMAGSSPAAQLLTRRLVEAELHHGDLGTGYGPADWPTAFATMKLTEPMQSLRQYRLNRTRLAHSDGAYFIRSSGDFVEEPEVLH